MSGRTEVLEPARWSGGGDGRGHWERPMPQEGDART